MSKANLQLWNCLLRPWGSRILWGSAESRECTGWFLLLDHPAGIPGNLVSLCPAGKQQQWAPGSWRREKRGNPGCVSILAVQFSGTHKSQSVLMGICRGLSGKPCDSDSSVVWGFLSAPRLIICLLWKKIARTRTWSPQKVLRLLPFMVPFRVVCCHFVVLEK